MIMIKPAFSNWKEVDEKTALEFATHLYKGMKCSNIIEYINTEKLKGISFTEKELVKKNILKIEKIPKEQVQISKNIINRKKGKYLHEMTKDERKEYELLLNKQCRLEMKIKLEADIMRDLIVCNMMGESSKPYLMELKKIIDDTLNKIAIIEMKKKINRKN